MFCFTCNHDLTVDDDDDDRNLYNGMESEHSARVFRVGGQRDASVSRDAQVLTRC